MGVDPARPLPTARHSAAIGKRKTAVGIRLTRYRHASFVIVARSTFLVGSHHHEDRGIEQEQARIAQTSQCDLLRQPGLTQCGIYCEAAGFIARVISRCTLDSSWSSDRRGGSIDEHRGLPMPGMVPPELPAGR